MLSPLDVIWIHDAFIRPPGPKMAVCICPKNGLFFRINTEGKWPVSVFLPVRMNSFLHHDSHLQCGQPSELDDYVIERSIEDKGIIGKVNAAHLTDICNAISRNTVSIRKEDKVLLRAALGCP
ncbi:hypothetical protein [Acidomonas methanolica]|uniref:hypothetical protein n=1 Tax=Acidomonas methanolica TaxID=437 RepID=UPI00211A4A37|nr:hypothetical protein [Acidomonas methanolica]MCQ9157244.1 hypothetical protein [Acidomonas methanolica]